MAHDLALHASRNPDAEGKKSLPRTGQRKKFLAGGGRREAPLICRSSGTVVAEEEEGGQKEKLTGWQRRIWGWMYLGRRRDERLETTDGRVEIGRAHV